MIINSNGSNPLRNPKYQKSYFCKTVFLPTFWHCYMITRHGFFLRESVGVSLNAVLFGMIVHTSHMRKGSLPCGLFWRVSQSYHFAKNFLGNICMSMASPLCEFFCESQETACRLISFDKRHIYESFLHCDISHVGSKMILWQMFSCTEVFHKNTVLVEVHFHVSFCVSPDLYCL